VFLLSRIRLPGIVAALVLPVLAGPSPDGLDVQGHRGFRGRFPENTLPAFEAALELGVTTLELDLQVTHDRVLVVHHDQKLRSRFCSYDDGGKVPGQPISELNFEELSGIDCGNRVDPEFPLQQRVPGTRIPRLEQVLELARDADYPVRLNIEIKLQKAKHGIPVDEFAQLLVALVQDHGVAQRTTVQSFDVAALQTVRHLNSEITCAMLVKSRSNYDALLEQSGATILSPKFGGLHREDVERFQARDIRVIPWTVNRPADIRRMIEWGVDGIISDYPDRVLEILREPASAGHRRGRLFRQVRLAGDRRARRGGGVAAVRCGRGTYVSPAVLGKRDARVPGPADRAETVAGCGPCGLHGEQGRRHGGGFGNGPDAHRACRRVSGRSRVGGGRLDVQSGLAIEPRRRAVRHRPPGLPHLGHLPLQGGQGGQQGPPRGRAG